jgi:NAD+ kinase
VGKSAVLFVNHHNKSTADIACKIRAELEKRSFKTTVFSFEGKKEKPPEGNWDIAFSLGGDGTVLYTARCLSPLKIPILPVNLGSFGFIAGVNCNNWLDAFEKWERGEIKISRRAMFDICVERDSKIIAEKSCLNDAVISAASAVSLINIKVCVESDEGGHDLCSYRCNGIIIATPTGSTAFSMSAGGPILDPEMEALILNPVCPFATANHPFVFPLNKQLVVKVEGQQRSSVLLTVDGQDNFDLECSDKIRIKLSPQPALLIYTGDHSYYSALKTKLFRSEGALNA